MVRTIDDAERRARLGVRHALAARVDTVEAAVQAMVCLHTTEMANTYLAAAARSGCSRADVSRALYADRTVVRQPAMRRTLFTFPRATLPAVWGSAAARVATQQRIRLAKDVREGGVADDGTAWLEAVRAAVVRTLGHDGPATTARLRERVPALNARIVLAPGKPYAAEVAIANRVMTVVAADGAVLRGANDGDWRSMRPVWTRAEDWLGERPEPLDPAAGYAVLVGQWLRSFGPGTEADVAWWLGATKGAVRAALVAVGAIEVRLSDGRAAYVAAGDAGPVAAPEPWAALLPALDPTTMGWQERDFYLAGHRPRIFDTNGNAGTTAWWCGRIVGGWSQNPDGEVVLLPLADVGVEALAALRTEAERLTAWFDGELYGSIYHAPLTREHRRETGLDKP